MNLGQLVPVVLPEVDVTGTVVGSEVVVDWTELGFVEGAPLDGCCDDVVNVANRNKKNDGLKSSEWFLIVFIFPRK